MKTVYLAGPITGLSYGTATDWRASAIAELANAGVLGLDPMRGKDYLLEETSLADSYGNRVMSTGKGITTRDRWDCFRADVVVANFIGAERVSIGTVMELAWADSVRTPLIVAMDDGNPHDHAMVREVAGFIVPSIEDAVRLAIVLLGSWG